MRHLKCVNSLNLPYVNLNEMSLLRNTSPLLLNINIGSKYYAMFVSFLKHAPMKLILYLFINKIKKKKTIVYMFVSFLKHVPHYGYMNWGHKFGQFMLLCTITSFMLASCGQYILVKSIVPISGMKHTYQLCSIPRTLCICTPYHRGSGCL